MKKLTAGHYEVDTAFATYQVKAELGAWTITRNGQYFGTATRKSIAAQRIKDQRLDDMQQAISEMKEAA